MRRRYPNGIDAVIDAVNRDQAAFAGLVALVRHGGRAASVVGGAGEATEIVDVGVSNVGGNPEHLSDMADLVVKENRRYPTCCHPVARRGISSSFYFDPTIEQR